MSDILNSVFGTLGKHFSVGRGSPPASSLKGFSAPPLPHDTAQSQGEMPFFLRQALAAQGGGSPAASGNKGA